MNQKRSFLNGAIIAALFAFLFTAFPAKVLAQARDIKDHVKLTLRVNGDSAENSHVSIRWGHRDFHENEYFPRWDVSKGTEATKEIDISDDESEFEIQTQGGKATGYSLVIEINNKPAVICKFNAKPDGATEFRNVGVVYTQRSSPVNSTGEGNLRINFNRKPNPGPIPMKP